MARPKNGNGGRPKKPINWEEAKKLCSIQCSELEVADWFHISVDTLARRLREEKDQSFAEFFKEHRVAGKIALRRNMFKMSGKSPQMAIFLAKNWLGMKDSVFDPDGDKPLALQITVVSAEAKKHTEDIVSGKGTEQ